jgi:hypothetical protein
MATERAPAYGPRPDDALLFRRMRPFQESALDTLALHRFFAPEALADGWVKMEQELLPPALAERIQRANKEESDLMEALRAIAADYPLEGAGGVKDRTGLLEHRYDGRSPGPGRAWGSSIATTG